MHYAHPNDAPYPCNRLRKIALLILFALAWSGLLLQLWLSLNLALANGKSIVMGLAVYLGYFTVLTNIFVALVLTFLLNSNRMSRFFAHPQILLCAAISIALVGLGYHFLLRHIWHPQGLQWLADVQLHYITPLLFCVYWLMFLPKPAQFWRPPVLACIYPIAYFAYALLRGKILSVYPYPFIDVIKIGYGQTLLNGLALLIVFMMLGWFLLHAAKAISRIKLS